MRGTHLIVILHTLARKVDNTVILTRRVKNVHLAAVLSHVLVLTAMNRPDLSDLSRAGARWNGREGVKCYSG